MTEPELVILAGPNGVGKTTFAKLNLSSFIDQGAFLNADDIARDVNPSDVEAVAIDAGRQMLNRRKDFHQAASAGYRTRLFFLFTPLPHLNELRVMQRVMTASPIEVVRKNEAGVLIHDKTAFILLNETIVAAGGQPLAGI